MTAARNHTPPAAQRGKTIDAAIPKKTGMVRCNPELRALVARLVDVFGLKETAKLLGINLTVVYRIVLDEEIRLGSEAQVERRAPALEAELRAAQAAESGFGAGGGK